MSWGQNLVVKPTPNPPAVGCVRPGTAHTPAPRKAHHSHGQGTTVTPQGGKSRAAGTGRGTGSRAGAGENPQRGPQSPSEGRQPHRQGTAASCVAWAGGTRGQDTWGGGQSPQDGRGALAQPRLLLTIKTSLEGPAMAPPWCHRPVAPGAHLRTSPWGQMGDTPCSGWGLLRRAQHPTDPIPCRCPWPSHRGGGLCRLFPVAWCPLLGSRARGTALRLAGTPGRDTGTRDGWRCQLACPRVPTERHGPCPCAPRTGGHPQTGSASGWHWVTPAVVAGGTQLG